MSRLYDDWFWDNLDRLTEEFIKIKDAEHERDYDEYIALHYGEWEDWVWEQYEDYIEYGE